MDKFVHMDSIAKGLVTIEERVEHQASVSHRYDICMVRHIVNRPAHVHRGD